MSNPLRILFAGTPEFAANHLQALIDSGHQIVGVLSQPDRPSGRGRKTQPTPVKSVAVAHGIPVWQPLSLRTEESQASLRDYQADVMVVVAYGLLLPKAVLDTPRLGCINVHGSILPRWRGAAPIQRAIMAGDTESGITIMQMDVGLDTGDMLDITTCPIAPNDASHDLHDRLITLGCPALISVLDQLAQGTAKPVKQDDALAVYAHKLSKDTAHIDWTAPAQICHNLIRGLNPWPIATTLLGEATLRVWSAEIEATDGSAKPPGTLLTLNKKGISVQCGTGILRITSAQLPGGKALSAADLLNSRRALFESQTRLG